MSLNRTSEDLKIYEGSTLRKRYKVEAFLGEGSFGLVTKCLNTETNRTVAIKINQSHPETVKQAILEIVILKHLRCLDPDTCNIARWNGFFFHREHICLEFELLDQSLYDYLNARNLKGLPVVELKPVLHQLATALNYLRSQRIIHADLKPENIMVVDRRQLPIKVKMIDFGLAHPAFAARPGVSLQTIFFRAPEVMMRMPYSEAIDMWSLGVIAVELATGYWMYPGNTDYEVLRFIVETQGQPADYVLDRGQGSHLYFRYKENSRQRWIFKSPEEYLNETGFKPNETRSFKLRCLDDLELLIASKTGHHSDLHLLVSLIKRMLALDADLRIKPEEVLHHPLFKPSLPQTSDDDTGITDNKDYDLKDSQRPGRYDTYSLTKDLEGHKQEDRQRPVQCETSTVITDYEDYELKVRMMPLRFHFDGLITDTETIQEDGQWPPSEQKMSPQVINPEENNKEVNIQTESPVKKDSKWKQLVRRITNACRALSRKLTR